MTIGLCGAHRTGKTTLARKYAEEADLAFVETSGTAVFKKLGFDPKLDYDFKTRLYIQRHILESMNSHYCAQTGLFITDRTPIDALAYTIADVQRTNVTDGELLKEFDKYQSECFEILNRHFAVLMVIQPGIPMVETEGKAPINMPYIEHLNFLTLGLVVSERVKCRHFQIPRFMTDLEDRLSAIDVAVSKTNDAHFEAMSRQGVVLFH